MILCIGATPAAQRVMVFRRLTLEAVNRAHTTLDGVAGKSVNVAKVLQALGQPPVAVGFLGGERGETVRGVLAAKGIELDFVTVAAPTRQCVTVIDEAAGAITELVEESRPVMPEDYEKLFAVVRRRLPGCRAVVMSGTLTPGAPVDFYRRCVEAANAVGARTPRPRVCREEKLADKASALLCPLTIVDAQGPALLEALQAGPGLVKPNRAELAATLKRELKAETALREAMRELRERGAQRVVITAGKEPTLAFDGQTLWRIRPPKVAAVNPIGSGDAFTAGLVWRLVRGDDLGEACRWAAAAGAANALSLMPGELKAEEVERLTSEAGVERL